MSNESPEPGQVRIPGVRYRKEKRTRNVEVTVRGRTRVVPQEYTVLVPAPPRDLDRVWLRVVIGGAVLFTAIAVAWSTASIGDLLSRLTTPLIAYFAASAFESVWVLCLIVEWVMRRQPDRARVAQVIGWAGLVVVVAAVVVHGFNVHEVAAGIVGGFVSVVAKSLWWVVFRIFHVQLSDLGVAYLQQAREDLAVAGVLVEEAQRLNATQAYYDAVYGPGTAMDALAGMRNVEAEAPALPASSPVVPDVPPVSLPPVPAPTAAPAPAVSPVSPQVTPAVAAPVPPVSSPAGDTVVHPGGTTVSPGPAVEAPAAPAAPTPPAPAPAPATPVRHLPAAGGQQTKTGFIRDVLASDPAITLDDLTDRVREEFGDKRDLRKDVSRLRRRITKEAS